MAILLGISPLWGQEVPTNKVVALKSNYDYHDAFAPFFIQKTEQQHVQLAVSRVMNIGKIELITFLQQN